MGARLPDFTALGDVANADSNRVIAKADTSAIGEGVAALGTGIAKAGEKQAEKDDELNDLRAETAFKTRKINLDSQYARDHDPKLQERYEADLRSAREDAATVVRNPKRRENFVLNTEPTVAAGTVAAGDRERGLEKDKFVAGVNQQLIDAKEAALKTEDPAEREDLIRMGSSLIERMKERGYIGADQERTELDNWREGYAKGWLAIQPLDKQKEVLEKSTASSAPPAPLAGTIKEKVVATAAKYAMPPEVAAAFERTAWIESKGNASATSPTGAAGVYQFTRGTGKQYGIPGDSRYDADANIDAAARFWRDNANSLRSSLGREPTGAELYLAHQQGAGGAGALLRNPEANVVDALVAAHGGDRAKAAQAVVVNGGRLSMTAGQFATLWTGKFGSTNPTAALSQTPADFIPYQERVALKQQVDQKVLQVRTHASADRGEELERGMIDAAAGKTIIMPRAVVENDPLLLEAKRNDLLRSWDKANGDAESYRGAVAKFQDPNAGSFTPFDKDEKSNVDKIYQSLGSTPQALQAVAERTGMVPSSAGQSIRSALISNDAGRVAEAMQTASNLLTRSSNIFTGVDGREQIESAAVSFRQYVEHYGDSADKAAQRIIRDQSPEYQAQVKARVKNEDVDQIIKKQLSVSDLTSAFNEGLPIIGRPTAEFTPAARGAAFSDYAELFKEKYLETGDVAVSKDLAVRQMKKIWGVSELTGTRGGTIMRFPPDKVQALHGIPDPAKFIAEQAQDAIAQLTVPGYRGRDFKAARETVTETIEAGPPGFADGVIPSGSASVTRTLPASAEDAKSEKAAQQIIPREKIMLTPLSGGQTSQPYLRGDATVPYSLSWIDKDGNLQTLPSGKAFAVDVGAIRAKASDMRRVALEKGNAETAAALDAIDKGRSETRGFAGIPSAARAPTPLLEARRPRHEPVRAQRVDEGIPSANN